MAKAVPEGSAVMLGGPLDGQVKELPEPVDSSLWHTRWQPYEGEVEEHGYRARFNPIRGLWELRWLGRYHGTRPTGEPIYTRLVPPPPGSGPS